MQLFVNSFCIQYLFLHAKNKEGQSFRCTLYNNIISKRCIKKIESDKRHNKNLI